jgi:hypothetical protein
LLDVVGGATEADCNLDDISLLSCFPRFWSPEALELVSGNFAIVVIMLEAESEGSILIELVIGFFNKKASFLVMYASRSEFIQRTSSFARYT